MEIVKRVEKTTTSIRSSPNNYNLNIETIAHFQTGKKRKDASTKSTLKRVKEQRKHGDGPNNYNFLKV